MHALSDGFSNVMVELFFGVCALSHSSHMIYAFLFGFEAFFAAMFMCSDAHVLLLCMHCMV